MNSIFSYSVQNSPVHRMNPALKLVLLLAFAIADYFLSPSACMISMFVIALLQILSKVPFRDYLHDLKPITYFCIFLVLIDLASCFIFRTQEEIISMGTISMALRMLCAMQCSSLFFRTTSYFQLRSSLRKAETALTRGKSRHTLSTVLTLFISFLPKIFAIYSDIDLAYRSRGGRNGLVKALRILPVVITCSLKKADDTFISMTNRLN